MSIEEIKSLLKSGDVAEAEAAAQALLTAAPDNVQAKMLYGTCRQLQGDDETFRQIHDKLAPKMTTIIDSETQGLWRKFHEVWLELIVYGGLVVTGGVVAVACLGKSIVKENNAAYRGPGYQSLQKLDSHQDVVSKWELEQGGTANVMSLRKNQTCPVCNGTGLTCAKTRCKTCDGYGKGR